MSSPFGLMGVKSSNPPRLHDCCYPSSSHSHSDPNPNTNHHHADSIPFDPSLDVPLFYDITFMNYATSAKTVVHNVMKSSGDAFHLSTDYDDIVPASNIDPDLAIHKLKFETDIIKVGAEAKQFMTKYFKNLVPSDDCIVVIGDMEVEGLEESRFGFESSKLNDVKEVALDSKSSATSSKNSGNSKKFKLKEMLYAEGSNGHILSAQDSDFSDFEEFNSNQYEESDVDVETVEYEFTHMSQCSGESIDSITHGVDELQMNTEGPEDETGSNEHPTVLR
ncbi:hypothetical protein BKA69DRAFT_1036742 [Paraphysoderma sedebokerense]|nr:hypothetical protein BKA69DRAFT_1036742 [Paraphysoderma sedebokerense]